jgi:hypothetical protein
MHCAGVIFLEGGGLLSSQGGKGVGVGRASCCCWWMGVVAGARMLSSCVLEYAGQRFVHAKDVEKERLWCTSKVDQLLRVSEWERAPVGKWPRKRQRPRPGRQKTIVREGTRDVICGTKASICRPSRLALRGDERRT